MSGAVGLGILLLALTIGASCALLLRDLTSQPLARRVQGLNHSGTDPQVAVRAPGIRRVQQNRNHWLDRVLLLLGYNADNLNQYTISWPIVVCLAGAAGFATWYYGGSSVGRLLGPVAGLGVGALTGRFLFKLQSRAYAAKLLKQMPDAISLIVRGSSVGIPVSESIQTVATEMAKPTATEFRRLVDEIAVGATVEEAVWNIYKRTGLTEYSFLAVTLGLQERSGGNLSETLDNLADIVRKRLAMAARAKALSSESRMAAMILTILPFAIGGMVYADNPGYLQPLFTPQESYLLRIAAVLMIVGQIVMRWLMRQASEG